MRTNRLFYPHERTTILSFPPTDVHNTLLLKSYGPLSTETLILLLSSVSCFEAAAPTHVETTVSRRVNLFTLTLCSAFGVQVHATRLFHFFQHLILLHPSNHDYVPEIDLVHTQASWTKPAGGET